MSKFTNGERSLVKNIVANLTIKRIEEEGIIKVIFNRTGKTIGRKEIWNIRERIKRESYHWYKTMREGEYEYIHEFKERINEIMLSTEKASSDHNDETKTTHRFNRLPWQNCIGYLSPLSNLYDVAPTIIGVGKNATISITPETKTSTTTDRVHRLTFLSSEDYPSGSGIRKIIGNMSSN